MFQCDGAWWGSLAGLPWIPPPHARAVPGSTNFIGTNAQAHLLVMSFNSSKRTYGKLIFTAKKLRKLGKSINEPKSEEYKYARFSCMYFTADIRFSDDLSKLLELCNRNKCTIKSVARVSTFIGVMIRVHDILTSRAYRHHSVLPAI